jgi:hypothetical protein
VARPHEHPRNTVALKQGRGGQETYADVTYSSNGTAGTSFSLIGKSDHKVNWLTFGIAGLAANASRATCASPGTRRGRRRIPTRSDLRSSAAS